MECTTQRAEAARRAHVACCHIFCRNTAAAAGAVRSQGAGGQAPVSTRILSAAAAHQEPSDAKAGAKAGQPAHPHDSGDGANAAGTQNLIRLAMEVTEARTRSGAPRAASSSSGGAALQLASTRTDSGAGGAPARPDGAPPLVPSPSLGRGLAPPSLNASLRDGAPLLQPLPSWPSGRLARAAHGGVPHSVSFRQHSGAQQPSWSGHQVPLSPVGGGDYDHQASSLLLSTNTSMRRTSAIMAVAGLLERQAPPLSPTHEHRGNDPATATHQGHAASTAAPVAEDRQEPPPQGGQGGKPRQLLRSPVSMAQSTSEAPEVDVHTVTLDSNSAHARLLVGRAAATAAGREEEEEDGAAGDGGVGGVGGVLQSATLCQVPAAPASMDSTALPGAVPRSRPTCGDASVVVVGSPSEPG